MSCQVFKKNCFSARENKKNFLLLESPVPNKYLPLKDEIGTLM